MQDLGERTDPRPLDPLLYLVGVAGLAAGITLVFLGMRAVMDVGGMCAEGGPYVIETTCPEGSTAALLLGIFGGMASLFLAAWKGAAIGGGAISLLFLAWPALFGALGFNFLQYGVDPPGDDPGWAWGWLVCGAIFWAMAFGPLLLGGWTALGEMTSSPSLPGRRNRSRPAAQQRSPDPSAGATDPGPWQDGGARAGADRGPREAPLDEGLVDALERLSALRERGELTADEYAAAKRRLLAPDGPA